MPSFILGMILTVGGLMVGLSADNAVALFLALVSIVLGVCLILDKRTTWN